MKIYKHTGDGHWIGSCIVLVANNIDEAEKQVLEYLDAMGLSTEAINIKEYDIVPGTIIHESSGEY